jgi:BTB/POZ domain
MLVYFVCILSHLCLVCGVFVSFHSSFGVHYFLQRLQYDTSSYDFNFFVGGRSYGGHAAVLAARCAFFAGAFRSKMRESKNREMTVLIGEVSPPPRAFQSLLSYIYTGRMVTELVVLAVCSIPLLSSVRVSCVVGECSFARSPSSSCSLEPRHLVLSTRVSRLQFCTSHQALLLHPCTLLSLQETWTSRLTMRSTCRWRPVSMASQTTVFV